MQSRYILITGGAGFIGTNLALSYLEDSQPVHIFDNLSRPGVEKNVAELIERFPGRVLFTEADVRNRHQVDRAIETASVIYHLAAQVAVTTSLEDPMADLQTNLLGTCNVLEAVRQKKLRVPLLFTSTNKVYGHLLRIGLVCRHDRYQPESEPVARAGAGEAEPLEFLSPYGCSKGSADQYVLDYAHSYGLPATVFRMSCIYGPYQLGSEDQGWVAHFIRQAMKEDAITIYGDGRQVRDLLFVTDLVRAMRRTTEHISSAAGQAFNMGGGVRNSISLVELLRVIRSLTGSEVKVRWGPARLADQRWYVADTSKIEKAVGWAPEIGIRQGLKQLYEWYLQRPALAAQVAVQVA